MSLVDPFGLSLDGTQDQGTVSKYQKWHNLFGAAGMFWDGFDVINAFLYAKEGDWLNAGISLACGLPAVGNGIAAVARSAKLVKCASAGAKVGKICQEVGKIGNTAAAVKAVYDTYQEAQKFETTAQKAAYIAGTLIVGYAAGKAANWGVSKLKTAASKVMPRLKSAFKESAGKLVGRISGGIASSGSGHMNRNRGYVVWPFGESDITTGANSKILSRNLAREGRPVGRNQAAAHIVASTGSKRQWVSAADSRNLLRKYNININDAANGIPVGHPRPHNLTHNRTFHEMVNSSLHSVETNMLDNGYGRKSIRSALRRELRKIGGV